jgi:hypothetical protein
MLSYGKLWLWWATMSYGELLVWAMSYYELWLWVTLSYELLWAMSYYELWATMSYELWAMSYELWAMSYELWAMSYERLWAAMSYELWASMSYEILGIIHSSISMISYWGATFLVLWCSSCYCSSSQFHCAGVVLPITTTTHHYYYTIHLHHRPHSLAASQASTSKLQGASIITIIC